MKMNLLDKAISYVSPKWAMQRAKFRAYSDILDSAYSGASIYKRSMRNWNPSTGDANADFDSGSQKTLVSRCRDAHRNQAIAHGIIDRMKHNVVGVGLKVQSKIDYKFLGLTEDQARETQTLIEREFYAYSESFEIDYERDLNFYGHQVLALVSALNSGDVFINTPYLERQGSPYATKIQIIESDRISNPSMLPDSKFLTNGIEKDYTGAPVAYHIRRAHPGDINNIAESNIWDRIEVYGKNTGRRRVFHVKDKERPGQYRGVPFLAPILEKLRMLDKYSEAELTAAVIAGLFTVFVESDTSYTYGLPGSREQTEDEKVKNEISLGNGAIVNLASGEKISSANPGRPNANYDPFTLAILKEIGAALGLSLEFMMLFFQSSYSASRAAILQAWNLILYLRGLIVTNFCQPYYELFIDEMVASGRLIAPNYSDYMVRKSYLVSSWVGPTKVAMDELKEVNAAAKRIELGISTRQKESEEITGLDWLDALNQGAIEEKLRSEAGLNKIAPATQVPAQDEVMQEEKANAE